MGENNNHKVRSPTVTMQGQAGVDDHTSDIFFSAVETTRMPIILTDPNQHDNPIVFANHAFLSMTGYSLEDVLGHNCRFLQGPETDKAAISEVRQAIQINKEIAVEILNYRKDGTTFWNALFVSPVYNKTGDLVYFFASQLDISRRRDAEEALRQSQKMEAVGQLTGGIAHDFNNLLQIMSGYLESIHAQAKKIADQRMVKQINIVVDATNRATTLTKQLLAFSRKQKLEGRVVNLNRLIDGMTTLVHRSLGDHITYTYELFPGLWNTRLDPSQAEMAILNIMINARDAMNRDGNIRVKTENVFLDLTEASNLQVESGYYVVVLISDNGCGICREAINHVLEPFYTTKEEGKGTGLGLSMVYGFVKQTGGTISILSEIGHGTEIRLFFPATDNEVQQNEAVHTTVSHGCENILVVDDRIEVGQLSADILEEAGYKTFLCTNGDEALRALDDGDKFNLVFSDLIMPGMNGVTLAREVKRRHPEIKILLTTGYAELVGNRSDFGQVEFDTINKPFRHNELTKKVRMILDSEKSNY